MTHEPHCRPTLYTLVPHTSFHFAPVDFSRRHTQQQEQHHWNRAYKTISLAPWTRQYYMLTRLPTCVILAMLTPQLERSSRQAPVHGPFT